MPCPACISSPIEFPNFEQFLIFLNSFVKFLFDLIKLDNFPVCNSAQSAFKTFESFIFLILGLINKLVLIFDS